MIFWDLVIMGPQLSDEFVVVEGKTCSQRKTRRKPFVEKILPETIASYFIVYYSIKLISNGSKFTKSLRSFFEVELSLLELVIFETKKHLNCL
jgi:hypothetical protein